MSGWSQRRGSTYRNPARTWNWAYRACNLLVYSAGGYTFEDFLRTGAPLLVIMWLALSWLLPQFYPLRAVTE